MNAELIEVKEFLALHPPFSLLSEPLRAGLPGRMEIRYARRGTEIFTPGGHTDYLHIVRSGAVEIHGPDGELLRRLGEGEVFGAQALIRGGNIRNRVVVLEDLLLYLLPEQEFHRLCREDYLFAEFFVPLGADRLRNAMRNPPTDGYPGFNLGSATIEDSSPQPALTAAPTITVREAAERMMEHRASVLLLTEQERLVGIVTDHDLTTRIVATGLPTTLPVSVAMTPTPVTMRHDAPIMDGILAMVQHNINHLPVMEGERLVGVLTSTDLAFRQLGSSPLYMAGKIARLERMEDLQDTAQESPRVLTAMVNANATAQSIGRTLTHLADAITVRLIRLAEEKLGTPPMKYAWLAGGSQGRQEMGVHGDQDNCLVLEDRYDPALHGPYFEALSRMVCEGLHTCGYVYCRGEMMASNHWWRQPLRQWRQNFAHWIEVPEPKSLMLFSVFFDLRVVHGEAALYDDLQKFILKRSRNNTVFLAHMAANALSREPPLGFFRNLVLERSGEHAETLDLKLNGVIPIVDLARVFALEKGVAAVNTWERLQQAAEWGSLSREAAQDLSDAMDFLGFIRFRHQARCLREGCSPDNHLPPADLSAFERQHLKDAFLVVRTMQRFLEHHHQSSFIS